MACADMLCAIFAQHEAHFVSNLDFGVLRKLQRQLVSSLLSLLLPATSAKCGPESIEPRAKSQNQRSSSKKPYALLQNGSTSTHC